MKITVVIPCRNEVNYIEECIDAIFASELPDNCEVSAFIVDGLSDDGTVERIDELSKKYPNLSRVDNEKQLTPFAFNLGIYAGGKVDYVQIVGARHIISKNYLMRCIERLESDSSCWCVGGRIQNEYVNAQGEIISKAMQTAFGMGIGNFRVLKKSGYTDTVTSPMYPYWVFEKIGFFDEELTRNQDDDFNFRVTQAGGKIYFEHEISLKYYVRGTFKGLKRQFFQYGYWKVYVNKKHKAVTTLRQLLPPLFVLYLLSIPLSLLFGSLGLVVYSTPLAFYAGLLILFSVKGARTAIEFFKLIRTYIILHVQYGLGYVLGIVHFLFLNRKPSGNQNRLSR
ncbi:MAG: GT2 family glycosyltransferase [Crocinitomicaceae bacterium]|jgi:GT2 family glycosyltransferase